MVSVGVAVASGVGEGAIFRAAVETEERVGDAGVADVEGAGWSSLQPRNIQPVTTMMRRIRDGFFMGPYPAGWSVDHFLRRFLREFCSLNGILARSL
jgi:hypothetical protein